VTAAALQKEYSGLNLRRLQSQPIGGGSSFTTAEDSIVEEVSSQFDLLSAVIYIFSIFKFSQTLLTIL
jgi:hypothetical protein